MSNKAINWAKALNKPKGYKAVLVAMADSANEYMATWLSRDTVSKRTGYKPETVRDYQNAMVKDGTLIAVPWQTERGADAAPGYFLGCVVELFDELPPLEVAFAKRINFKGPGKGGRPRGYTPDWWSGKRVGGGHRCTCCGGICHGGEEGAKQIASDLLDVSLTSTIDPGEGRKDTTLEGRNDATLPGGCGIDPFNPQEDNPQQVVPQPRANAEAFARSVVHESGVGISPGGGSGGRGSTDPMEADGPSVDAASAGAPAGDGASRLAASPRPRDMDQSIDDQEPTPPPVAEVLKNAATGEPSQRPGVGDLVPRQIHKAQQAYELPPQPTKPEPLAEWPSGRGRGEDELRSAERAALEAAASTMDLADVERTWIAACQVAPVQHMSIALSQGAPDFAAALRKRFVVALNRHPLSAWPQEILPAALRASGTTEAA